MKNKEIEEVLNKAKDIAKYGADGKQHTRMFNQFEAKALLSCIEQLQNNRDKAIDYINNLRDESAEREGFYNCFPDDLYIADIEKLLNILKGGNDE